MAFFSAVLFAVLAVAHGGYFNVDVPSMQPTVTLTLGEARNLGLFNGKPDICVKTDYMTSTLNGVGCCHGLTDDAECLFTNPTFREAHAYHRSNSVTSPSTEIAEMLMGNQRQFDLEGFQAHYRQKRSDIPYNEAIGKDQDTDRQAEGLSEFLYKCDLKLEIYTEGYYAYQAREALKNALGVEDKCKLPSIIEACPTFTVWTFPLDAYACVHEDFNAANDVELIPVGVGQGWNALSPVRQEFCDRSVKEEYPRIANLLCNIESVQRYDLEVVPTFQEDLWLFATLPIKVASGCACILDYCGGVEEEECDCHPIPDNPHGGLQADQV